MLQRQLLPSTSMAGWLPEGIHCRQISNPSPTAFGGPPPPPTHTHPEPSYHIANEMQGLLLAVDFKRMPNIA